MRLPVAVVVLLLVGCSEEVPVAGAVALEVATVDAGSAEEPTPYSPTVGNPCEPSFRCDVPLPPAEGCECVPPLRYPTATASVGAFCQAEERRCCAWFVVAPAPFTRWENCGDGWECEGDRCP